MAIFITDDTYVDFARFKKEIFYEQAEPSKDDYIIICGGFGGVWDGRPRERCWLDWLEAKPFNTRFVSGNHDNYDLLAECPVQEWHGGRVQFIRPSIIHLMRGQVYEIEGKRFFTMVGATVTTLIDSKKMDLETDMQQKMNLPQLYHPQDKR